MAHQLTAPLWGLRLLAGALLAGLLATCSLPDIPLPAPAEAPEPPCAVIPPSTSLAGYDYQIPDGAIWYSGCYNPNNADEAAVVADLPDPSRVNPGYGLYKLNLRTGQRTLLYDGVTSQTVDWSRTGWILFLWGAEAWKVKANGDSATQITATNRSIAWIDAWSPDGKQVLCYRNVRDYSQCGLTIYTDKGAFVRLLTDAATRAYQGVGWSPDGRRLAYMGGPNSPATEPRLCIYDLTTDRLDTLDVLHVLPRNPYSVDGVRWLPNGTDVVWAAHTGVAITNTQTRRTRFLRTCCPGSIANRGTSNRGFSFPCPSPDGRRILVARGDFAVSPTNTNLIVEQHSIETMNLQGGDSRKYTQ